LFVHDREATMIERPEVAEVMSLPPTPEQLEAQEQLRRKWERMQKKIDTAKQFGLEMPELEEERVEKQPVTGFAKVRAEFVDALVGTESMLDRPLPQTAVVGDDVDCVALADWILAIVAVCHL
jgi:hypothetical protein